MSDLFQNVINKSIKLAEVEKTKMDMHKLIERKLGVIADYEFIKELYKIANSQ